MLFEEACKFIEERAEFVTKLLTRQHRNVIKQFIDFKERSEKDLQEAKKMQEHVAYLETMVALKSPCMQAEHVIDDATALSLYDSLIPKLREHRKFRLFSETPFSVEDFKSQLRVRELEHDNNKQKLYDKLVECEMLKQKVEQVESESSIVKWYIRFMEDGIDSKQILEQYERVRTEYDAYKRQKEAEIPPLHR